MSDNHPTSDHLLNEADDHFQQRDYQTALEMYEKSYNLARNEFNRSIETEALAQIARIHLINGEPESGKKFLDQASEKVSKIDPMGYSRFLGVKGRFEWKADNIDAAVTTFTEMFVYSNAMALWGRAVDAANMLAILSHDPKEQIQWCQKGIEAAETSENEQLLGPLWNNLAATYYDLQQYELALESYIKSREYHWRFSGETAKLFADYHIGMSYRLLGQNEKALSWLRPVLAWAERLQNHSAIGQACEDIAECQIALGNKEEGIVLLKRAKDEYAKAGFDKSWVEIWDNINKRIEQVENIL